MHAKACGLACARGPAATSVGAAARGMLEVVLYALLCSCTSEFISWFLVYRKESFKQKKLAFARARKAAEKRKLEEPQLVPKKKGKGKKEAAGEVKDKKLAMLLREEEHAGRALVFQQNSTGMVTSVIHIASFIYLKGVYEGVTLAQLPFVPFHFIQALSHRGLAGTNMRDCGFIAMHTYLPRYIHTHHTYTMHARAHENTVHGP